uniref:NADH-ubiquinone oxidoreductase chain 5 n=1 Tax=Metarhizium anisopliae TaxID=5530 RepID=Q1EFA0_METAN|nr:NADH dehydrogenase subunit 5 [Metarhizium anisopliae]AAW58821.1 NADH dehydrogenase subunit 5 [Metarhizium anisopliae]
MYLSIIILPLLGSIVSGFFGRKVGVTVSRLIGCSSILAYYSISRYRFFLKLDLVIILFLWLYLNYLSVFHLTLVWNFQFYSLTVSMLLPVLVICTLVHFYSIGYMSHDPHSQRFFSYLSLFTFMMIILVTGNNYLVMFVGWEGVGVCSYLLVSFLFTIIAANQSSLSAFLTNRVGDSFLTIGMFILLWSLGNLDYSTVFSIAPYINENIITIIGICLLIGAMAKSSQVGLHIWLPMAMEGPTPVSALIHAATMVTAWVYLLIRSSPLIEYSSTVLLICLWLGAVTTVFSSLIGLFQQDIKKIIAYSTMSQLGMMVIAIGLSSYNIAIFHLINHAFYKGLLFLGAGAVIHAVSDNQDLRRYGGLISFLPLTYTVILIASLSLVAFPFMTGFYSKDFILESAYGQYHFSSINVYFIATIGAIFTTLYSVKVLYLTFLANPNGPVNYYKNAHEGDIFLSLPLVILAIFSIYFGFLTKDIFIGLGSGFFTDNSIFIHPMHEILIDTEFAVPTFFKLLPFFFTVGFSALAIIYPEFMPKSVTNFKLSKLGYYVFGFFNQRFLVELFYNKYIVNTVLDLGGQTTKVLDKGSIEWVGPYGMNVILTKTSKTISGLSKGVVTDYALYILIGVCFYLSIFSFVSVYLDLVNVITVTCVAVLLGISNYVGKEAFTSHDPIKIIILCIICSIYITDY